MFTIIKPYLYGALVIVIVSAGLSINWLYDSRLKYKASSEQFEQDAKDANTTIKTMQADAVKTNQILEAHHNAETKIEYVDKIVTKNVIKYRDNVITRVELPADFVRIYNESTESVHSENSATGTNDSSGTLRKIVTDADVLEVATSNNRICLKYAQRLISLQDWAKPLP